VRVGDSDTMSSASSIHPIDSLIGRAVVARSTANRLGQVNDLIVSPSKGEFVGLSVRLPDESLRQADYREIYSFGPDAVMIENDESAVPVEASPLKALPLAKGNLVGADVVTGDGKLLGQIANVYFHLGERLLLIYEVRSSILDKLLGHALFFPASQGRAVSDDFSRVVVEDDTASKAERSLAALAARLFGPVREDPVVVVRSRGPEE
jgi:uncharacterized protein YrrD